MNIAENLKLIQSQIPAHVTLVAVSKTKPIADIMDAYNSGHRIYGENRVLELRDKQSALPKDIEWHFIGHLQSNKIKYIAPFVHLIHSVDSLNLLVEINKEAKKNNRLVNCLLQFHIATEESKYGFDIDEAEEALSSSIYHTLNNVKLRGVMGMATYTEDEQLIREEFKHLKKCFEIIKANFFADDNGFKELSMGMTNDYKIAIEEGSTMIRIGSAIFGERNNK